MLEGDVHGMKRLAADVMSIKTLRGRERAMRHYGMQRWQAMVRDRLSTQKAGRYEDLVGLIRHYVEEVIN